MSVKNDFFRFTRMIWYLAAHNTSKMALQKKVQNVRSSVSQKTRGLVHKVDRCVENFTESPTTCRLSYSIDRMLEKKKDDFSTQVDHLSLVFSRIVHAKRLESGVHKDYPLSTLHTLGTLVSKGMLPDKAKFLFSVLSSELGLRDVSTFQQVKAIENKMTEDIPPSLPAPGASTPTQKQAEQPKFRWSHIFVELGSVDEILKPIKSSSRLKYTSITVSTSYIAVGSSTGSVYIFDKESLKWLHHLKSEQEGSVTQLSFSPDDNVLAHASSNGYLTVTELNIQKRASPRRLRLSMDHKGVLITSLEWNPQGTQLFIGDEIGRVSVAKITKSIAKDILQIPSEIILRLDSKVVQLSLYEDKLVISTLKKTYLCNTVKREYSTIGKQERNGTFGSLFFHWPRGQPPMILCARPRSRVWQVQLDGQVVHTHQFKDMLNIPSIPIMSYRDGDVTFPDQNERCAVRYVNFNRLKQFGEKFVFTWSAEGLYVFNPYEPTSIFWSPYKDILDISMYRNDIFILDTTCHVTKLSLVSAERSVARLFQHELWKQSASTAYFFKTLISPESVRKLIPREMLLDLREQFLNNQCDLHLKKVEELLDSIQGGVGEDVPPLIANTSTVHVLDSGIHVVNRPKRSGSELSDYSGNGPMLPGGDYLQVSRQLSPPLVQTVENVDLIALNNNETMLQNNCSMLSINVADIDAMLSKSLVVSSPEEFDIFKYDINQNKDSNNAKDSSKHSDETHPNVVVGSLGNDNRNGCVGLDEPDLEDLSGVGLVPSLQNVIIQSEPRADDTRADVNSNECSDVCQSLAQEQTTKILIKDHFCDIDLGGKDVAPFSDSSCEFDQRLQESPPVLEQGTADIMSRSVELPGTEGLSSVPAVLERRASDTNLVGMDSPTSARRGSLLVAEVTTKTTKKGRRKTAALVEFDEPKGKLPGKGRIYRQRGSSRKNAKEADTSSLDGDILRQDTPSPTLSSKVMNGTSSPQLNYKVHRPPRRPGALTPPIGSPQRDRSPSRVPQPHGHGAEPNIKHLLEATRNVLQSTTKSFFGNLRKNITETLRESMMPESAYPAFRMMAENYETQVPMDVSPTPQMTMPSKISSTDSKQKRSIEGRVDRNFLNVTIATSKAILNPAIGYNKKKLREELEKWVPHLNNMLHDYNQSIYDKKLAEFVDEKKLEQMPFRDIFINSLESSSSNEVPVEEKVDNPYHLDVDVMESKRSRSPMNYLYDDDVNTGDVFSVLHAPIKKEIEGEPSDIVEGDQFTSSVGSENETLSPKVEKTEESDDMQIDYTDFDLDMTKEVYVSDPFCLPKDFHAKVSKLVLLCLELGIDGQITEKMLPVLSERHKCFMELQKSGADKDAIPWSESGDSENSFSQTSDALKCSCSSSMEPTQDFPYFGCGVDNSAVVQTSGCKNCLRDSKTVIFMRCYFHFLNIPILKRFIDHCHGRRRITLWNGLVDCLHVLADSSDPFTNLIRRNELSTIFQFQRIQELIESPAVLSHVVRLFDQNQSKTIQLCADLHKVISPLDVLYVCRKSKDFQDNYLTYLDKYLAVTSNTDAARESMISHICQEKEVKLAWLECLLSGRNMETSCSCGMPRPLGHTVTWDRRVLIDSIISASAPSSQVLYLCKQYGYWQGCLACLQFPNERDLHLEILIQLGEFELLEKTIKKETDHLSKADFEKLLNLKQKQTMSKGDGSLPQVNQGEHWYCLNCQEHLPLETRNHTGHDVSTGINWSKLITWENLAKLILKNIGHSDALDMLQRVDVPRGALSAEFLHTCLLAVGVNQKQDLLMQEVLERMDNYLWRRRPGCMAPQLAYSVQKESAGGDRIVTENLFTILHDKTELKSQYLENPACHWGVLTDLKSVCICCSLPLTETINQTESGLIIFNCGHVYHKYCVPQKLCAICLANA